MSQPFDRGAQVKVPGKLDEKHQEFWVSNPWEITSQGHNLSAFERNRTYLNQQGQGFVDVSFLSGTDSDGDGRAVIGADFRNTGQIDLVVRQIGGGALFYFKNELPKRHYLTVTLRGVKSNKLGIGARLTAFVGDRQIVRENFPVNSFQSHMPSRVQFGLADDDKLDKLVIRWPSGLVQTLTDIAADRHIVVEEGKRGPSAIETVIPGELIRP